MRGNLKSAQIRLLGLLLLFLITATGVFAFSAAKSPQAKPVLSAETALKAIDFAAENDISIDSEFSANLRQTINFNRNRYYSPALGRFFSKDPVGFFGGDNLWRYADNNPVLFTDPFGLAPKPEGMSWSEWYDLDTTTPEEQEAFRSGDGIAEDPIIFELLAGSKAGSKLLKTGKSVWDALNTNNVKKLTKEELKAVKSYKKQIVKHQEKIKNFKENPTVRPGMENCPQDLSLQQQNLRIKHLEKEIETFLENIVKILGGKN